MSEPTLDFDRKRYELASGMVQCGGCATVIQPSEVQTTTRGSDTIPLCHWCKLGWIKEYGPNAPFRRVMR